MKATYICVQGSYQQLEVALFSQKQCLARSMQNVRGSSTFIPLLDSLLKDHGLSLTDLSFIAVDCGPGAFTSLRVTITSINALAFGAGIPLIGINGLDALAQETVNMYTQQIHKTPSNVIALLNAYNNELYTGLYGVETNTLITPVLPQQSIAIETVLEHVSTLFSDQDLLFVGNGFTLHEGLIRSSFKQRIIITDPLLQVCSVDQISVQALEKWKKREELSKKLIPIYLKLGTYAVRKT